MRLKRPRALIATIAVAGLFTGAMASYTLAPLVVTGPSSPAIMQPLTLQPAAVCDNTVPGPASPPAGAVVVPAGNNASMQFTFREPGKTFWFAAGVHTLGTGQYDQIIPGAGSTFLGAPGAILDGQGRNQYAFTQQAANVTIRYLTIQGFVAPHDQGVVNHDSGDSWTIEHNTMQRNQGGALMAGANQVVRGNCFRDNGQYAMNAFKQGNKITNLLVEHNEIVGNATDPEPYAGCGCSGGVKFWAVNGATVRDNWVHDNRGYGLWADTNNNDFLVENNLIERNHYMGFFYEISYNATVRNNAFRNNAWIQGRQFAARGDSFPIGAIYLSEADGDSRVASRANGKIEISGNEFTNNWGGIVGWENADRFCNSPNNPTRDCTRVVGTTNLSRCSQPAISQQPLYWDCRWRTSELDIHHNLFSHNPTAMGCTTNACGRMALFSNVGTSPDWSPYKGTVIQEAISRGQNNRWHDNTYVGNWTFAPFDMGHRDSFATWRSAWGQDAGSTYNAPAPPTTTVPSTTVAPPTTTGCR